MNITIRDIDEKAWRELRSMAVKKGLATGKAINMAIRVWIQKETEGKKRKQTSFFALKPIAFKGPAAEYASLDVDKILYGLERRR